MTAGAGSHAGPHPSTHRPPGELREALRERASRLARFGYGDADAEFLVLAGLVGGYFVRRQYRAFAGCRAGGRETSMLRRATACGHAVPVVGKGLYRLARASLGRAIGLEDGLPVPGRAWRSVKKGLMALDYCIEARSGGEWLLAEPDKARGLGSLGVPSDSFPVSARTRAAGRRAFPDALPVLVHGGDRPAVSLCCVHAGTSETGILRQLSLHEPLAAALHCRSITCEWVVLADSPIQFPRVRAAWRRWRAALQREWAEREYFELRLAVERRCWSELTACAVERLACLRAECDREGTERRYRRWLENGRPGREPGWDFGDTCRYREILLDHDYSIAERVET